MKELVEAFENGKFFKNSCELLKYLPDGNTAYKNRDLYTNINDNLEGKEKIYEFQVFFHWLNEFQKNELTVYIDLEIREGLSNMPGEGNEEWAGIARLLAGIGKNSVEDTLELYTLFINSSQKTILSLDLSPRGFSMGA
jgi:hypothetical protein